MSSQSSRLKIHSAEVNRGSKITLGIIGQYRRPGFHFKSLIQYHSKPCCFKFSTGHSLQIHNKILNNPIPIRGHGIFFMGMVGQYYISLNFGRRGVNFSGGIFGYYCIFITKFFRKGGKAVYS